MEIDQVAVQLYTIRDYLKTPAQIGQSLKKIRSIGYQAVQVSGMGPIDEKELLRMFDGEGLVCCATHEDARTILDNPEKVVERLGKLNCRYTAYPYPAGINCSSKESVQAMILKLNEAGKRLYENGMTLTYHNHHVEFAKMDGKTVLEKIYDETDPRYVQGEIDTYWVQTGGGNPVQWCVNLAGRLPLIHLKDYGILLDDRARPVMREIGEGNLDWKAIADAAQRSGCLWFIVEQDENWVDNDPFESLRISFEFMKNTLCQ